MGKKPFINKKQAETFEVVQRSQRDKVTIGSDSQVPQLVLAPKNRKEPSKIELPKEVLPGEELQTKKHDWQDLFYEADPDILRALEAGSDSEDFEELDDDFVIQAENFEDADEDEEDEFAQLRARNQRPSKRVTIEGEEDEEDDEEEDDEWDSEAEREKTKVVVHRDRSKDTEGRKLLEARFENLVKGYEEDDIGELDEENPELQGKLEVNAFNDILDEFLEETEMSRVYLVKPTSKKKQRPQYDDADEEEYNSEEDGEFSENDHAEDQDEEEEDDEDEEGQFDDADDSDAGENIPRKVVNNKQKQQQHSKKIHLEQQNARAAGEEYTDDEDDEEYSDDDEDYDHHEDNHHHQKRESIKGAELDNILHKEKELDPVLKRYLRGEYELGEEEPKEFVYVEKEDQFDCQSIISTYSNLENHPKLIVEENKRKQKPIIQLSSKTGLPLGVLQQKAPVVHKKKEKPMNKGEKRTKQETPEEKKARKKAIKDARAEQREKKKALKMAFKNEELNQQQLLKSAPTSGLTTFKL